MGQVFALSWLITWYGHVLKDFTTIVRLYDFFLATHPLMPVYFGAAVSLFPCFRSVWVYLCTWVLNLRKLPSFLPSFWSKPHVRYTIEGIKNRWFRPGFSSHLASIKCNILRSISHKAKQARFKCNISRSLSHKPKKVSFKYNIPRSKIGGLSKRGEMTVKPIEPSLLWLPWREWSL